MENILKKLPKTTIEMILNQDDREVNALVAIYKQYGLGGSNGYLKIKIKVQGIDNNKDGNADANAYNRQ